MRHPDYLWCEADDGEPLTCEQWDEWIAYWNVEPWGDRLEDTRFATLSYLTASAHLKPQGRRAFTVDEFRLHPKAAPVEQTEEEVIASVKAAKAQIESMMRRP